MPLTGRASGRIFERARNQRPRADCRARTTTIVPTSDGGCATSVSCWSCANRTIVAKTMRASGSTSCVNWRTNAKAPLVRDCSTSASSMTVTVPSAHGCWPCASSTIAMLVRLAPSCNHALPETACCAIHSALSAHGRSLRCVLTPEHCGSPAAGRCAHSYDWLAQLATDRESRSAVCCQCHSGACPA